MASNSNDNDLVEAFKQKFTEYITAQLRCIEMTSEVLESIENVRQAEINLGNQALLILQSIGIDTEEFTTTIEEARQPFLSDNRMRDILTNLNRQLMEISSDPRLTSTLVLLREYYERIFAADESLR